MFLIFDTETTGLPRNYAAPLTDFDNWPRVVQLAWQLHDEKGYMINFGNLIIQPDGFNIPYNAEKVHGISTLKAKEHGIPLSEAMEIFSKDLQQAKYLVGHNVEFDINILGCEYLRLNQNNLFDGKSTIDTKDESTEYCAIPGGKGGKFKWPTLEELYHKLFNKGFDTAHNAGADVEATTKAFFELCTLGIIKRSDVAIEKGINRHLQEISVDIIAEVEKQAIWLHGSISDKINTSINWTAQEVELAAKQYVHLHNHTQFSVLQATSSIKELVKKAGKLNMPALALTDNGNMYGAFQFWDALEKHNKGIIAQNEAIEKGEQQGEIKNTIKCIIGCELNITKDRFDRKSQNNGYAQVFLAKNKVGYENLCKLSSAGYIEGFYYVPRVDKNILEQYKEGLIATTGGLNAEIPSLILNVGEKQAEDVFLWYKEQFGTDFYIEINRHNLPDEDAVNAVLLEWSKKHGVQYFAANNNYYLEKEHANSHDILLCVKDGELQSTPIGRGRGFRFGFPNQEFYFKTQEEMKTRFSDIPDALSNAYAISEKIETYKLGRDVLLPKFDIPAQFENENAYLKYLTYVGANKRYLDLDAREDIKERIDFELATIERMGFPGYFLIVQDFTTEARKMGVSVGPGRGSAAGSVIAYCLGITNVDPIQYDLLFERFLNPDRISMPDIDIDFDDQGRDKVIKYVINKYGHMQVAQIITYGTMGGKSAIKDAARVLNLPLQDADRLTKAFPESLTAKLRHFLGPDGIDKKFKEDSKNEVVQQAEAFRKLAQGTDLQATILKRAYELEGSVRNTGIHACGIIITPAELTKFVPVAKAKDSDMLVTQFDNSVAESAGLLKMDFLGLRTLTIIKDALRLIKKSKGIDIDIDNIPLEDLKTYELFQRGETNGIFQFESPGMQKHMKDLKPDSFTDLIAMNALYRPGPLAYIPNYIRRKHGKEPIVYDFPEMEDMLKETYGITVYQEQVMRLSQKLAGFTKGDADVLRKAMGKKQIDVLNKMKSKYLEGCAKNNLDTKVAEKVWTDWEAFASYAFNKSHSTCYALLAYQTAYLKAHYPAEFMASTLTHTMGDLKNVTFFMDECRRMNIRVLGPDVNESEEIFTVNKNGEIRFSMAAIKGVGESAVERIIEERQNGLFKSLFDFVKRADLRAVNKRTLENLSAAGAFDAFEGVNRSMFLMPDKDGNAFIEKLIKFGNSAQQSADSSQASLFGDTQDMEISEPALPVVEEIPQLILLQKEKEVVGVFISGHPLDDYKIEIQHITNISLGELSTGLEQFRERELKIAGMITGVNERISKNGKEFALFTLEDFEGTHEFALFGEDFIKFRNYLKPSLAVYIKGRVQPRYMSTDSFEFKIQQMQLLSELKDKVFTALTIRLPIDTINEKVIQDIETIAKANPGKGQLNVMVEDDEQNVQLRLNSRSKMIQINGEAMQKLQQLGLEFNVN
jgi:DNA polymerase III subunit alpha